MPERAIDWTAVGRDAAATMSRYVQFDTTNPPGCEMAAAEWLRDQLVQRRITRDITFYEPAPGRGLLLGRVKGSEPLKPLLINHHMDVVAADPAQWTYPPFSGTIADGFVWGRGTLDTKNLGVIFLMALETLLKEDVEFRRPLIFLAVPDEEAGGAAGMGWLIERYLQTLDPEWVWDEGSGGFQGLFGDRPMFGITVAEKQIQQIRLVASGLPGHASMPHGNNANVTLLKAIDRVLGAPRPMRVNQTAAAMFSALAPAQKFPASFLLRHLENPLIRRIASRQLSADRLLNALVHDTISLTVLQAGYKANVIPERAEAALDCRLLPDTDAGEFLRWLNERIADERVAVEVEESSPPSGVAPLDGPFYRAAVAAVKRQVPGAAAFPLQMPAATDGRYFRQRGYAAYGFSPMLLGPGDLERVHGIDERISVDNLILGIKIARDVIRELCA